MLDGVPHVIVSLTGLILMSKTVFRNSCTPRLTCFYNGIGNLYQSLVQTRCSGRRKLVNRMKVSRMIIIIPIHGAIDVKYDVIGKATPAADCLDGHL
jgi:hypothetical protein